MAKSTPKKRDPEEIARELLEAMATEMVTDEERGGELIEALEERVYTLLEVAEGLVCATLVEIASENDEEDEEEDED
ncbi:MAG: hypothetical protein ACO3JL_14925 [Myxococcota bacterium]